MCKELETELERGSVAASELVAHMLRMGAAQGHTPVEADGRKFVVFVTAEAPVRPLTLNQLQAAASRTLPPPGDQHFFWPNGSGPDYPGFNLRVDLIHAVFGVAGEAGELCDPVKKAMFYGKPLDVENIKEEAGDLLWYIAGPLCRALGVTLEELAAANVAKLRKRYPEKYSDAAAVARADKVEERGAPFDEQLPKPSRDSAGNEFRRRNVSEAEAAAILNKYKFATVEDGHYYDEDDKCWRMIPELWEPANSATVYSRPECVFHYCPHPEECKTADKCRSV